MKRYSSEISRVVDLASEEFYISGDELPLASHLLVAILAESDNQAAHLLRERGLTIRFVRAYFRRQSYDYVQLPSSGLALNLAKGLRNFGPFAKIIHPDFIIRSEIFAVLQRAEWLLKENEALSAGLVLLSMMRNPRTGVAKFFRESDIDVEELDSCLTQLKPLELRKLSIGEKLICLMMSGSSN